MLPVQEEHRIRQLSDKRIAQIVSCKNRSHQNEEEEEKEESPLISDRLYYNYLSSQQQPKKKRGKKRTRDEPKKMEEEEEKEKEKEKKRSLKKAKIWLAAQHQHLRRVKVAIENVEQAKQAFWEVYSEKPVNIE